MADTDPHVDERLLRALGDPMRQRVLTVLNERAATASEVAAELDTGPAAVRGHIELLVADGAAERIDRGGGEPSYRATIRPFLDDAHWAQLPVPTRRALVVQNLRQILDHLEPAAADGAFDDPRTHVSLTRIELDEQGWQEVADLLGGVLEEVMDIHADSIERLRRGGTGDAGAAELVILNFRSAARSRRRAPDQAMDT
jgi:DNA-binding transcriptional ArsR family regulator